MTRRNLNKELEITLKWTRERTGLPLNFHTHNQKGYGILYLETPDAHVIDNRVAGSMWSGISRDAAMAICEALESLANDGYITFTGKQPEPLHQKAS